MFYKKREFDLCWVLFFIKYIFSFMNKLSTVLKIIDFQKLETFVKRCLPSCHIL